MQKWAQKTPEEPEPEESSKNGDEEKRSPEEGPGIQTTKVKSRLKRRSSIFNKASNKHIQRNEERDKLIEKAKIIFNTIVGTKAEGLTLAGVITHLDKFGECWTRFPKTNAEINMESAAKLIYVETKLGKFKGFLYSNFSFISPLGATRCDAQCATR